MDCYNDSQQSLEYLYKIPLAKVNKLSCLLLIQQVKIHQLLYYVVATQVKNMRAFLEVKCTPSEEKSCKIVTIISSKIKCTLQELYS